MSLITKSKEKEIILFLIYFLVIGVLTFLFKFSYIPGVLLFFGVPSLYLTLRKKEIFKKTFISSLLASITICLIIDYIAIASKAWFEVSTLNYFIFKIVPVDMFVWGFLLFYFSISFYEYFLDKDKNKKIFSKNTKFLVSLLLGLSIIFGIIYLTNKDLFVIKYFYSFFILIGLILPISLVLLKCPQLMKKSIILAIFFLFFGIIYELSALYAGQWAFAGNYLGRINLFDLSFPIEELFYFILAPPALILVYEFFMDDRK